MGELLLSGLIIFYLLYGIYAFRREVKRGTGDRGQRKRLLNDS